MTNHSPAAPRRQPNRLPQFDYSAAGAYFVTLVTQNRLCLFGTITEDGLTPNEAGHMVASWWADLGRRYPWVVPDASVVMPNHFHGILWIGAGDDGPAPVLPDHPGGLPEGTPTGLSCAIR